MVGFPTRSRVEIEIERGDYRLRSASGPRDVRSAQRLRHEVFSTELGWQLADPADRLDREVVDAYADHLLVEHLPTAEVVGTYRLLRWEAAGDGPGFCSASEYDLRPLRSLLPWAVEASRACVAPDHRGSLPFELLWQGIARYLEQHGKRYLFGLCTLGDRTPESAARTWATLRHGGHVDRFLQVDPLPDCRLFDRTLLDARCDADSVSLAPLLRRYLRIGARAIGYPALDPDLDVVDVLILLDLADLPPALRQRYCA